MQVKRYFLAFLLFMGLVPAIWADPAEQLSQILQSFDTYTADFKQVNYTEKGQVTSQSIGTVMIKRPGKFRWETQSPTHQIIITDGQALWVYDVDLAQVSKQALSSRTPLNPAMILSGTLENLNQTFNVTSTTPNVFVLTPKPNDYNFKKVTLKFDSNLLTEMTVINNLSQTSYFQFSNVKINPPLTDDLFNFVPPAGVDVISQ